MISKGHPYSNHATFPCDSQYATVLDMTAGTQYILLGLVLAIGLGMLLLYFKINSTLGKTSETLGEISDLFDTLE
ncbi:MAG TPA: hypothetical protein C5S51_08205 [Methanosarcinaceae archaeon]|nr:hypothetical protein [Methanosarcinaceae archaeon]